MKCTFIENCGEKRVQKNVTKIKRKRKFVHHVHIVDT